MRMIPQQIMDCLNHDGLSTDDIDLFLLHQASKYIVWNIRRKLGLSPEKVPFLAAEHGNTVSSTIPLMLQTYLGEGPPSILISGFGVGLSSATAILKRT
jgi:3-oxoacyl-[acyl-carrier-protein] synthase-3